MLQTQVEPQAILMHIVGKSSLCNLNEQLFRCNFNGRSVYTSCRPYNFFCFGFFFVFISVEGFPRKSVNKKRRKTNLLCHHHHIQKALY